MSLATRTARARHDPGTALWAAAGAAWLLLIALALVATPRLAHHHGVADALRSGTSPTLVVLAVFAGFWLVMVVAMMLPTTVPMVRMFHKVSAGQAGPGTARASFLAAYFAIWLAFAAVALAGDLAVHATVERWTWLAAHDGLVLAGALALAGGMQFSALKQRCLTVCRDPRAMLFGHYRRGARAAWALGVRHGLSCLGCCWAIMLVMFATGVGSLWWMAGLTAVMLAEKTTRWGPRIVGPVGVVLLLAAAGLAVGEWDTTQATGTEIAVHDHGDPLTH
jgi:predicted metal-binding membrane protein